MKHSFLYLSLLLGILCWGTVPTQAKSEKKMTAAEKREQRKKEREARKKGKEEKEDGDKKDKKDEKVDKKAVNNAVKKLKTVCGRIKANGKYYMYVQYTVMTEDGEAMLQKLQEEERNFKMAKLYPILFNGDADIDDEEAEKTLKKNKVKYPMVKKTDKLPEQLPGYTPGSAPKITIVDTTGKVLADGGAEILDSWSTAVGAKVTKKEAKPAEDAETEEEPEEE